MSDLYHQFSDQMIEQAVAAALVHRIDSTTGMIAAKAECIDVSVTAPMLCLRLPFNLGDLQLTLPPHVGESQMIRICLDVFVGPDSPVGVRVTVSADRLHLVRRVFDTQ